jgi:hypothetical protein
VGLSNEEIFGAYIRVGNSAVTENNVVTFEFVVDVSRTFSVKLR